MPTLHILNRFSFSLVSAKFSIGLLTYKMGMLTVYVLFFHSIFYLLEFHAFKILKRS